MGHIPRSDLSDTPSSPHVGHINDLHQNALKSIHTSETVRCRSSQYRFLARPHQYRSLLCWSASQRAGEVFVPNLFSWDSGRLPICHIWLWQAINVSVKSSSSNFVSGAPKHSPLRIFAGRSEICTARRNGKQYEWIVCSPGSALVGLPSPTPSFAFSSTALTIPRAVRNPPVRYTIVFSKQGRS